MIPPQAWTAYLHWRPEFAKAMDEALYPLPWLDAQVAQGMARIAANDAAAVLYEYKQYPSGAVQVEALVAAGDVDEIVAVLTPVIEQEAAAAGAIAAQVASRAGWVRALRKRGYEPYQTTIRKGLAPSADV